MMLFFLHRLVCESFPLGSKIDPVYHVIICRIISIFVLVDKTIPYDNNLHKNNVKSLLISDVVIIFYPILEKKGSTLMGSKIASCKKITSSYFS